MQNRFLGRQDIGVDGVAVPIIENSSIKSGDAFAAGCSEGANVLYTVSQFLLHKQTDRYANLR